MVFEFQINGSINFYSCDIEIDGNRMGGFLLKFYHHGSLLVYHFFNNSLPGVLTNVASALTGFSPAFMIFLSCCNWSSIMDSDCLVNIEDEIVEGSLVLALDFYKKRIN